MPTARMTAAERYRERYEARYRFRPYKLYPDGEREWIACAGTERESGVVPMLLMLHEDGEYSSLDMVGVLDTAPWAEGKPGVWRLNPYD